MTDVIPYNTATYRPKAHKFIGDFVIDGIEIDGTDVTGLWSQFDVYETINGPMAGELMLIDSSGLSYQNPSTGYPFYGGEKVRISVDGIEYKFRVFKVKNRTISNPSTLVYVLSLISEDGFIDAHSSISEAFIRWKYEDIIKYVLEKYVNSDRDFVIHCPTLEKECVIAPNFSPFEFCSMLASRAESRLDKYSHANYLFFETIDGWHFVPYEMLLDYEQNIPFAYMSIDTIRLLGKSKVAQFDDRTLEDYVTIDSYRFVEVLDTFSRGMNGMYAASAEHVDLTFKPVMHKDFRYDRDFDYTYHVANYPQPIAGAYNDMMIDSNQRWDVINEESCLFSQEKPAKTRPSKWFLTSRALREQMNNFRLEVITGMIPEIRVGMTVNVRLPKVSKVGLERAEADEAHSGRYLITKVRKTYNQQKNAFLTMEMAKDCIEGQLPFSI